MTGFTTDGQYLRQGAQMLLEAAAGSQEGAARAEADPAAVLGTYEGRSRAGTMTVWVDHLGRMKKLAIAPGSVQEGDELGVATALMEAYTEARKAAVEMAGAGLSAYRQRADDDEFDQEDPLFPRH